MNRTFAGQCCAVAAACAQGLVLAATPALVHADQITGAQAKALCARGDMGPTTPYGETAAEKAAKKVVFEWNCMTMVERKPREAFDRYVSKDWCDHGHLITQGKQECGSIEGTIRMFQRFGSQPLKDTDTLEFPLMSSVDGDHVTAYGAGVDIFRVVNGKLTDHWDASPPAATALKGHDPKFPDWVMGGMKGPPPGINP